MLPWVMKQLSNNIHSKFINILLLIIQLGFYIRSSLQAKEAQIKEQKLYKPSHVFLTQ